MYSHKSITRLAVAAFAALTLVLLPAISDAGKPDKPGGGGGGGALEYDIYQLDSDGGAFGGTAADVNDVGAAVGTAVDASNGQLFAAYWNVTVAADGTVTSNLSLLPGSIGTIATGINNFGEVIGNDPFLGGIGALYWPSVGADPLPLHPLTGDTDALPHSINDAGIICGVSMYYEFIENQPNIQDEHPVVWRVTNDNNGNPVVLGPFRLPSVNGIARDLSEPDAGGVVTVVGNAWDDASSAAVAWRFHVEELEAGGILDDPQLLQAGAHADGVNNSGVSCGDSGRPDWRATMWTQTDEIPLALPRKFASSGAWGLNDSGVVTGWVSEQIGFPPGEAAVWAGPSAMPVLLSSFLSRKSPFDVITDAPAINDASVIVGAGWDGRAGLQQAFVAFPRR